MKDSRMAEESAKAMLIGGIIFTAVILVSLATIAVSDILGIKKFGISELWLTISLIVALFVAVTAFTVEYCRYKRNQKSMEKDEQEEERQQLIAANKQ